ncbi:MAG: glycosyltransferase family 39 protein [Gemmatimonadaceae bacterium]|nr:glycosyltransferase family 39 protein [Gemmatimonadaceae bacterium]
MLLPLIHSERPALALRLVGAMAVVALAIHIAANVWGPYGLHRDEFLYLSMGKHLRYWRMDFPPFIALVANFSRAVGGDTIVAIRLFPAIAHAALVLLAGLMTKDIGGGRWGQGIAAFAVLTSPLFMRAGGMLQPVVFDQLWWTLALFGLLKLVNTGQGQWWLAIGGALGAGLLTKFSIAFIGIPLVAAVLLTTERRWLATRWPWIALGMTLLMGAPSLIGQFALGFPLLSQMDALQGSQLERMTYARFMGEQLLFGPGIVLAVVGCAALIRGPLERYRAMGLSCLGAFLLLLLLHGKAYYIGPIYPALYAAGAARLGLIERPLLRRMLLATTFALVVVYGAVAAPLGVPFLRPLVMARYAQALGVSKATETNRGKQLALPQDYADMIGWREMVRAVADVYYTIPSAERADVVLIGENYGEAGALDFYGPGFGLPPVVSTAGSFWFFGPGERPGTIALTLGISSADLREFYGEVKEVVRFDSPWMVPEERGVEILIGRRPKAALQAIWSLGSGRN